MSKSFKKMYWEDNQDEEYKNDRKQRERSKQRRKEKAMRNALRARNLKYFDHDED